MESKETLRMTSGDARFVDDLSAPTIVVDGIAGAMGIGGMVAINCTQMVLSAKSADEFEPIKTVAVRLAIPVSAFSQITQFFQLHLERMVEDGSLVLEGPEAGGGSTKD